MAAIGVLVCTIAAWRLRATPLFAVAAATAALNLAAIIAALIFAARAGRVPRGVVALRHFSVALAAFFLFVSLTIR